MVEGNDFSLSIPNSYFSSCPRCSRRTTVLALSEYLRQPFDILLYSGDVSAFFFLVTRGITNICAFFPARSPLGVWQQGLEMQNDRWRHELKMSRSGERDHPLSISFLLFRFRCSLELSAAAPRTLIEGTYPLPDEIAVAPPLTRRGPLLLPIRPP